MTRRCWLTSVAERDVIPRSTGVVWAYTLADILSLCMLQVGKPGSSKSLALRLIHANLRGQDSSDDFFRQLPAVSTHASMSTVAFVPWHVYCMCADSDLARSACISGDLAQCACTDCVQLRIWHCMHARTVCCKQPGLAHMHGLCAATDLACYAAHAVPCGTACILVALLSVTSLKHHQSA